MGKVKSHNRFMELEGLRGVAAVAVVLFHLALMLYPSVAQTNMNGSPLFVFLYGTFSVMIFFVLSGFVLSIGFFQTKDTSIVKRLASKRYLRLMLPALASVLLAYILMRFGLDAQKSVAIGMTNSGWLENAWVLIPDFWSAIYDGLVAAFMRPGGTPYNGVLWTMYYEFLGSFVIFVILLVFGQSPYRWLVYLLTMLLVFNTWFMPIILGMILADCYNKGYLDVLFKRTIVTLPVVIAGLFLGGYPLASKNTVYESFTIPAFTPDQNLAFYLTIGALLVVVAVLYSPVLSAIFRFPAISILGKYTYSLYLTHLPVIYTLGTALFVTLTYSFSYREAAILTVVALVPAFVLASLLFYKLVDKPSIVLSGYFSKLVLGTEKLNIADVKEAAVGSVKSGVYSTVRTVYILLTSRIKEESVKPGAD